MAATGNQHSFLTFNNNVMRSARECPLTVITVFKFKFNLIEKYPPNLCGFVAAASYSPCVCGLFSVDNLRLYYIMIVFKPVLHGYELPNLCNCPTTCTTNV